eukprot:ANDGO_01848.mRNA.1 mitochondrial Rhomboid-like protein 14
MARAINLEVLILGFAGFRFFNKLFSNRQYGQQTPWVTLILLVVCFWVYIRDFGLAPVGRVPFVPALQESLFCPFVIVDRIVKQNSPSSSYQHYNGPHGSSSHGIFNFLVPAFGAVFHHAHVFHLLSNMGSLLHNGVILEDTKGSVWCIIMFFVSAPLVAAVHILLSMLLLLFAGYNEYHSCGIGLSGILFAMLVAVGALTSGSEFYHGRQCFFGILYVPNVYAILGQALVLTFLDSQVSFVAHASGFLVGFCYLWLSGHLHLHGYFTTSASRTHNVDSAPRRRRYVIRNGRLMSYE